ncbi:MAG TPA: WecB/TagA/CpsF family glycosyltransferase [Candidatus Kapabacteria bacterium]|nr:WecB/TagA/CpsF family glycosyltransferase [Candidatus Kapabacteria bacterium]
MALTILGVRIDTVTRDAAKDIVRQWVESGEQHALYTPNPEMLVDAQTDHYFRHVLNYGSLNICDGIGIEYVTRGKLKRIAGIDFMLDICDIAQQQKKRVYLLGGGHGRIIDQAGERLHALYPDIAIVGSHRGPIIQQQKTDHGTVIRISPKEQDEIIQDIIRAQPDILFVGFGHGKQEKWIYEHLKDMPSVKVAMGVGGSFDFLSGRVDRAPKQMQTHGLEWLWRLIQEPQRWKRILKATIHFPYLYYRNTFFK